MLEISEPRLRAWFVLLCLLVSICLRQVAAEVLLLHLFSYGHYKTRTISSFDKWQDFTGCLCNKDGTGECAVHVDGVNISMSTSNFVTATSDSGVYRVSDNDGAVRDTLFICKFIEQSGAKDYLQCIYKTGYHFNTVCGSPSACPYLLHSICPDNSSVMMVWNSSQYVRLLLYDSRFVRLTICCPSPSPLQTTTINTDNSNPEQPLQENQDSNDSTNVMFTGLHIGVIIAVSLASVVVTLIIVILVWKLRKKQNDKVPTVSQTFSISDAVSRDNAGNDDYDRAKAAYENTYTYTDTDVQPSSLQTVTGPHSDAGNADLPGDTVNIEEYTLANPVDGTTDIDDGLENDDLTTSEDEGGQYYYTTPATMKVETEGQPYSKLGDRPVVMRNGYDQLQLETE